MMHSIWVSVLLLLAVSTLDAADLKITTVTHHSRVLHNRIDDSFRDFDLTSTNSTYVHGSMRRYVDDLDKESARGRSHLIFIENCATREWINIDADAREYTVGKYAPGESSPAKARVASGEKIGSSRKDWADLRMSVETNVVDTGETMNMLGHTARHFVTTSHATPTGEAAILMGMRQETTLDEWYLDAELRVGPKYRGCEPEDIEQNELETIRRATRDERRTGPTPHGFVAKSTFVARVSEKPVPASIEVTYTETLETTVTEWSEASVDPALFAIPPGYTLVACLRGSPTEGNNCR